MNAEMKNIGVYLLLFLVFPSLGVTVELPRTGQRTCFDQDGMGIAHIGTGQDGDLQNGKIWPEPRFTDNGDGTVTDHLTGLMWMADGQCLGEMSWQAAMKGGESLIAAKKATGESCGLKADYPDWFLPDIRQLEMLFNGEEPYIHSWLNSRGFRNIQPGRYWSTTVSPNPYTAWVFRFDSSLAEQAARVESARVLLARREPSSEVETPEDVKEQTESRFVDNGDGTVTDTKTSLMWLQNAGCLGTAIWQDSFARVKSFNADPAAYDCKMGHGNYSDWSLPNRHELRSVIEHDTDLPALPVSHPFSNVQPHYWISTTVAHNSSQAYEIFMGTGELQLRNKDTQQYIWPVRQIQKMAARPRITDRTQTPVYKKIHSMFRSAGERISVSWPAIRFADQGDGTLIDNRSGLMWLKDSQCLGKRKWVGTFQGIERLNRYPHRVGCKEYTKTYEDWQLPDITTLTELADGAGDVPADWLNLQGAIDVSARDYWSVTENSLNIYYAWAFNLKQGTPRNYTKAFPLFVWPVRMVEDKGWVQPKPLITVNSHADKLTIMQGDNITLAAAISEVDSVVAADFRVWYEAPDDSEWWLSDNGSWQSEENILYHGNIFPLEEYPVFSARTTGMATGVYTIHFDISILLEDDELLPLFPTTFSSTISLYIDRSPLDQIKLLWFPEQDDAIKMPIGYSPQMVNEKQ